MQSWDGWSEKGRTQPAPDEPDGAPMGAIGAAASGSGTGGGIDGGGGTTSRGSVGVVYHWSQASILDATVAERVASVFIALKHLAVLLWDILR